MLCPYLLISINELLISIISFIDINIYGLNVKTAAHRVRPTRRSDILPVKHAPITVVATHNGCKVVPPNIQFMHLLLVATFVLTMSALSKVTRVRRCEGRGTETTDRSRQEGLQSHAHIPRRVDVFCRHSEAVSTEGNPLSQACVHQRLSTGGNYNT